MPSESIRPDIPSLHEIKSHLAPFTKANPKRAVLQLVSALLLYAAGWAAMYFSLQVGYWLTLLIAIPTAGFLVRIFIFFHDCGHNAFFPNTQWNRRIGSLLGILVFTPGEHWWHSHAIHHATSGNLDKRGVGDVTTLTVEEYTRLSWLGRLGYRLFRHPIVMFGLGPIWMFLISHRFPMPPTNKKGTQSVIWTNVGILVLASGLSLLLGFKNYVLIQLPVIWLAGLAGIWLFYIQHQFENVYWTRDSSWDYVASAFQGASYYKLPKLLQWFSGNIGFHHIHHLNPRVPNYALEPAYHSDEVFRRSPTISVQDSLACVRLALYDESSRKMVGFRQIIGRAKTTA